MAEESEPVTGRPNDIPIEEPKPAPLGGNSTLADRAKTASKATKAVDEDDTENKSVTSSATKAKAAKKK